MGGKAKATKGLAGPCAHCLPNCLQRGQPPAQSRQEEKRGQTRLSQPRPRTPSAETTGEHWGENGPGWSLSSPKRPRSLFNKMVFNRFKDFIRSSPWTNSRQCFLATIHLSGMPTSSCPSTRGCSLGLLLSQSLPECLLLCLLGLSLCSPLCPYITPVSTSASRGPQQICPLVGASFSWPPSGALHLPASTAPLPPSSL